MIEYGPLAEWKEIAGSGQEMQDVFWYIKEAIDAYFDGRPFQVTVKAGCLIGKQARARSRPSRAISRPRPRATVADADEDTERRRAPRSTPACRCRRQDRGSARRDDVRDELDVDDVDIDDVSTSSEDVALDRASRPRRVRLDGTSSTRSPTTAATLRRPSDRS